MMPIRRMHVKQFRGLQDQLLNFEGRAINAIIGQNASMKTTILGMIASSFSLRSSIMSEETMIDGRPYGIKLSEKFKFSKEFDKANTHEWTLELNQRISNVPVTMKSYARPDGSLRFWIPGAREKGDSLIQCPALYLSLKRLSPIGEEKNLQQLSVNMTDSEKQLFSDWHNEILISTDTISDTSILSSTTKSTIAPKTQYYDGVAISAGQDNIGKIILAVLSLKRLKEKYGQDYKGSVVCIDELESTLYPASQRKLISFLKRVSHEYSIQFFFTTHSMTIVRALHEKELSQLVSLNYAKKVGSEVIIHHNISLQDIENDLYILRESKKKDDRVKIYCEDEIGTAFTKCLIEKQYKQTKHVSYENDTGANLGYTIYDYLLAHKIPEFLNNIIVLDGDVKTHQKEYDKLKQYKNVVFLPKEIFPEKIVYDCIRNIPDNDSFWDNTPGGYSKQACFMNYTDEFLDEKQIKQWFKGLNGKRGKGYKRFISRAFSECQNEVEEFVTAFTEAYKYVLTRRD